MGSGGRTAQRLANDVHPVLLRRLQTLRQLRVVEIDTRVIYYTRIRA